MEFILQGKINAEGQILIANKGDWTDFLKANPNKSIVGKFEVFTGKENKNQVGLYKGVILPTLRKGFYDLGNDDMTEEDIDILLRHEFGEVEEVKEFSTIKLTRFFDFIQRYAAENLDISNLINK